MNDLLREGGVTSPQDKDTIDLMKKLGNIEKLEERLDAAEVEESQEFIEQDTDEVTSSYVLAHAENGRVVLEVSRKTEAVTETSDFVDLDISFSSSESVPSPVTSKGPEIVMEFSDEMTVTSTPGNIESVSKNSAVSDSENAELTESDPSEGEAIDELDMDTVLDGLDSEGEPEPTVVEETSDSPEILDTKVSSGTVDEGDEDLVLEDIFSKDDAVVTNEPAIRKSGQGEPTSKEKSSKKTGSQTSTSPVKKTDSVAVTGDIDIDNILDTL